MTNITSPLPNRLLPQALLLVLCAFLLGQTAHADLEAARRNMSQTDNPLLMMKTSRGDIYMELFPDAAPANVANFIALAEGRADVTDPVSGQSLNIPWYDGLRFHRVIPGTLIQAGAPRDENSPRPDYHIADEINAQQLGLNLIPVFDELNRPHPWLNIGNKADLEQELLIPLYRREGINNEQTLAAREFEILAKLQAMNLLQAYQQQGYRYSNRLVSLRPLRGSVVMANSGPDTNQTEFFITVTDTPWLTGRNTVIGQVVDGLLIADRILAAAGNTSNPAFAATTIYEIRQVLNPTTTTNGLIPARPR
ncbi:MAG: peptidylprolyl isomerase [Pseudomonadales bacterium]|nr:peptidylprolyl isomerase [Pseudomonadales bacterium]